MTRKKSQPAPPTPSPLLYILNSIVSILSTPVKEKPLKKIYIKVAQIFTKQSFRLCTASALSKKNLIKSIKINFHAKKKQKKIKIKK